MFGLRGRNVCCCWYILSLSLKLTLFSSLCAWCGSLPISVRLEFSSEEVYMESSNTVISSSASKSVRFESSSVQSVETDGVSDVFKLTRSTSADGRPVFTKTIEGSNLERKWVTLHVQWQISGLQWTTVILFCCSLSPPASMQFLWKEVFTFSLTVQTMHYCVEFSDSYINWNIIKTLIPFRLCS